MARKPNYNFERAERDRAKQAKADAKAEAKARRKQEEEAALAAGLDPSLGAPAGAEPDEDAVEPDAAVHGKGG